MNGRTLRPSACASSTRACRIRWKVSSAKATPSASPPASARHSAIVAPSSTACEPPWNEVGCGKAEVSEARRRGLREQSRSASVETYHHPMYRVADEADLEMRESSIASIYTGSEMARFPARADPLLLRPLVHDLPV